MAALPCRYASRALSAVGCEPSDVLPALFASLAAASTPAAVDEALAALAALCPDFGDVVAHAERVVCDAAVPLDERLRCVRAFAKLGATSNAIGQVRAVRLCRGPASDWGGRLVAADWALPLSASRLVGAVCGGEATRAQMLAEELNDEESSVRETVASLIAEVFSFPIAPFSMFGTMSVPVCLSVCV
jgi:hypothetical protein